MEPDDERDWGRWSSEAVALTQSRNRAYMEKFTLSGRPFRWDLDAAQIAFVGAESAVCLGVREDVSMGVGE